MGFLVSAAMMGNSSPVTRPGGVRMKTSQEPVTGSFDSGVQKNLEAAFAIHREKCMDLNSRHLGERLFSGVESSEC